MSLLGRCFTLSQVPIPVFCFSYFSYSVLRFFPYLCVLCSWDYRHEPLFPPSFLFRAE
jgi:hypothetical protein